MVELTRNGVQKVLNNTCNDSPYILLQIISAVQKSKKNPRFLISDGVYKTNANLAPELKYMIQHNQITQYAIIEVIDYRLKKIKNKMELILLEIGFLKQETKQFGNNSLKYVKCNILNSEIDELKYHSTQPLRREEVPNDFVCSICFGIPLKPTLLPCEHIFCEQCAKKALYFSESCPNCRHGCMEDEPKRLKPGTCLYRIWSSIVVKCPKHNQGCSWTGQVKNVESHLTQCQNNFDNVNESYVNEVERLKRKNEELQAESNNLLAKVEDLESKNVLLDIHIVSQRQKIKELESKAQEATNQVTKKLKKEIQNEITSLVEKKYKSDCRLKLPILFQGEYRYRRENVVQLSQLISRYLENKPKEIDGNKIYNCVRQCYLDLERDDSDNPLHYNDDMRMLLSTCYATAGWFSDKQRNNIDEWMCQRCWR